MYKHTDSFTIIHFCCFRPVIQTMFLWFLPFLKQERLQKQETGLAVRQVTETRLGNKGSFKHSQINVRSTTEADLKHQMFC